MEPMKPLARREFLKQTAPALAAAVAGGRGQATKPLPIRTLGKTGLKLPLLGFGGAALPKAWRNPLSHEDRLALVRHAFDRGLRYFDTAGNYMESQAILGEALQDRRREACLATKVETTQPEGVRPAVEKALKELRTDYLDLLLIHGSPGLEQMSVAQAMRIHAELDRLRGEKVARFLGFSAHGYLDKALSLIRSGGFDVCMLSCGYLGRGSSQVWSDRTSKLREDCLDLARERGMGIVAMKVLADGWLGRWSGYLVPGFDRRRLAQLPGAALRHVLQDPRIHLLVVGMHFPDQVDANIRILSGESACTPEDRALLAEFTARLLETETVRKFRVE